MTLQHGDIIKTQGTAVFPFVLHYGVVIQNGQNTDVMHNTPDVGGTLIEPLDSFLQTRRIVSVSRSWLNSLSREELLQRYAMARGRFDLISYNCEHFVERMQGNSIMSFQVVFWTIVALCAFFYLLYLFIKG